MISRDQPGSAPVPVSAQLSPQTLYGEPQGICLAHLLHVTRQFSQPGPQVEQLRIRRCSGRHVCVGLL